KMSQTVKPLSMFIHTNGSQYKMVNETIVNDLWSDLPQWEVKGMKDISDQDNKLGLRKWLYGRNGNSAKLDLQFNYN
ncbi:UNVERIFIED_CONTAM: hypothetical protein FO487_22360, partial [Bacillus amyloliquefaciens DSM 7 = ATCC 23350]